MPRNIRAIRIVGNIAYVPLTKGYEAVIDVADVPLVSGWNWTVYKLEHTAYGYRKACGGDRQRMVYIHQMILPLSDGTTPDHIDGDGLNNRRDNLRPATNIQQKCNRRTFKNNTSGIKGVSWSAQNGKWVAYIYLNGKKKSLGSFSDIEDAKAARSAATVQFHGEYVRSE